MRFFPWSFFWAYPCCLLLLLILAASIPPPGFVPQTWPACLRSEASLVWGSSGELVPRQEWLLLKAVSLCSPWPREGFTSLSHSSPTSASSHHLNNIKVFQKMNVVCLLIYLALLYFLSTTQVLHFYFFFNFVKFTPKCLFFWLLWTW